MLENFRLKVFRAVAEHLSFRKAGEALYLTQPAVTLQIKTLEAELGMKLFERKASGVCLTEAGTLLLRFAREMHLLSLEAQTQLARLSGGIAGQLLLGASTTIAQYVLPAALADFSRTYPEIHLQLFSQNTEQIAEGVASGHFSLGLIEGPAMRTDLKLDRWFDDEMLLVLPATHDWAALAEVEPGKLYDVPLVMRERGSGSRHVVERALQKAGLRLRALRIVMELDSTEAILSCVEQGLGVGFVSEWAVARHPLMMLRLKGTVMRRSFSFVSARGLELPPPAAAMLRFLKNHSLAHKQN